MIETPISDWNTVVTILFGLTLGIPLLVISCIKAEIYFVDKFKNSKKKN